MAPTRQGRRFVTETLEVRRGPGPTGAESGLRAGSKSQRHCSQHPQKQRAHVQRVLERDRSEIRGRLYPTIEVKRMLVDAAATALCLNPGQFDVMVMENMFGDILSDQGGGLSARSA
ncbi:MAG: isocitrate/isopropylmalate family dehydrogenase [Gammaproteobacteria bacterium]|nr:isocitrate/isopropylmalate family dehydrogenase [Gammaproteobacteria bacterium]